MVEPGGAPGMWLVGVETPGRCVARGEVNKLPSVRSSPAAEPRPTLISTALHYGHCSQSLFIELEHV